MVSSFDNFDYYLASLDQMPFHVGVDMQLRDQTPQPDLPYRAHIRLELNHPTVDGLATLEEVALLREVEQQILGVLPAESFKLVAHVTHRSARTMIVYMRDEPIDDSDIVKSILGATESHAIRVIYEVDPEWTEYRDVLYPSERFEHQIRDRHVLDRFEKEGDDCARNHEIEPRFSGLEQEAAEKLKADLEEKGFKVLEVKEVGLNGNREWQVMAQAISPLALAILDDFRECWIALARKHGGHFDGWSADVMPFETGAAADFDIDFEDGDETKDSSASGEDAS